MKMLAIAVATCAMVGLASPAFAQGAGPGSLYGNLGYSWLDLDNGQNVSGPTARVGYRFHQNFAVEGEATVGTEEDDFADLDNNWGVYGVGTIPVTDRLSAFGRIGYQSLKVDGQNGGPDIDEDGAGYGVGVEWRFSDRLGIRGDFTRLDNSDTDVVGISGTMSF